jgi:hypothetical protein
VALIGGGAGPGTHPDAQTKLYCAGDLSGALVAVRGEGVEVELHGLTLVAPHDFDGRQRDLMVVCDGSAAALHSCKAQGGIVSTRSATVELHHCVVHGSQSNSDRFGDGLLLQQGASAVLTDTLITASCDGWGVVVGCDCSLSVQGSPSCVRARGGNYFAYVLPPRHQGERAAAAPGRIAGVPPELIKFCRCQCQFAQWCQCDGAGGA